jgi:hypothetical protein
MSREPAADAETALVDRAGGLAARMLRSISEALEAGVKGDPHPECIRELRAIADQLRTTHPGDATPQLTAARADGRWQLDALVGQLASAVELAAHTSSAGTVEFDRREAAQPWGLGILNCSCLEIRHFQEIEEPLDRCVLRISAVCHSPEDYHTRNVCGRSRRRGHFVQTVLS